MADMNTNPPTEAVSPSGINHLVLNVRDIDESHKFWTEIVGFKQVGELHPRADRPTPPKMRFYSAVNDGKLTHHTVALVESPNLPPPAEWVLANSQVAINHVALTMPNREAWLKQLAFLQSRGVKFNWRVNHGVTHSVYINDPNGYGVEFLYEMPREMWENDIDGGHQLARKPAERGPRSAGRPHRHSELRQEGTSRGPSGVRIRAIHGASHQFEGVGLTVTPGSAYTAGSALSTSAGT